MNKVLIAGGAGYVGSMLTRRLIDRGYDVTIVDKCWFGAEHLDFGLELRVQDVMDLQENDLKHFDTVVFLAGLSNDPMAEFSPVQNFMYNGACPAYLAYIAKRAGVRRFVHGGSCSVYGYTVNELYDETAPAVSAYPYGISKLQGEQAAMQMADKSFSVIGLRKGTISGYSPRMRFDLVVNAMFRSAVDDNVIKVNNPSIWRPILSMKDAVDAYVRAIEAAPEISGIFNAASGNYTVGEIGDVVAQSVKYYMGIDASVKINNIQDFRNYKVTSEKAASVLGFHPRECVRDIVKELAEHHADFGDMEDDKYYNIRVFKKLQEARVAA